MKITAFAASLALCALSAAVAGAAPVPANGIAGALIASGGGAGSFSTVRAFSGMIGDEPVQTELATIRDRSTVLKRDEFIHQFDFAVSDAWTRAGQDNVTIPDSTQRGMDLAKSLYGAGMQGGAFSGDAFFSALFTPRVWNDVSHDIDAKYGAGTSASFSGQVAAMFEDLGPQLH